MKKLLFPALLLVMLSACANSNSPITASGSQLQLRQVQTRVYDTRDTAATLRSVIATLQDLGFVIDKADHALATISATKMQDYTVRMTVTVRERGEDRSAVRASARINETVIDDPESYRDFFSALDKAMFLTLHKVD